MVFGRCSQPQTLLLEALPDEEIFQCKVKMQRHLKGALRGVCGVPPTREATLLAPRGPSALGKQLEAPRLRATKILMGSGAVDGWMLPGKGFLAQCLSP